MPVVSNKSARIYHFESGMCGPGQSLEVGDEEFNSRFLQLMMASGELVEEKDEKKLQAAMQAKQQAEQSAERQVGSAEQRVAKAQEQVQKAHEAQAKKLG